MEFPSFVFDFCGFLAILSPGQASHSEAQLDLSTLITLTSCENTRRHAKLPQIPKEQIVDDLSLLA